MGKAYSNRALPAGTVLREWRLEEVLGVGGFGIVYKGRGIYFNELVAIKEYFPSSISERDEDDTVVPIDSDAEEVHALGLKKFVEEAKLLWNLSTPTRHPNIVSVRSLFEIHGTAYMVMDFEDGTPLSRILKQGRRFNEASLRSIILPIAEGLERAHRVGVLHRDIKPPNIIINDDGRSVLIDFGSARFESGEATSTKVTFHTPPYAAIEQYVRTFQQGPWTDIYALGVLLYECITGTKPAEVLERLHGDAGEPLADGSWPGFSRNFLRAVDRAMAIRPDERPQSISEWIALLDQEEIEEDDEDSATRIGSWDTGAASIVPVAPPKEGFAPANRKIETGVPDTPSKAEFDKRTKRKPNAATPVVATTSRGKDSAREDREIAAGRDAAKVGSKKSDEPAAAQPITTSGVDKLAKKAPPPDASLEDATGKPAQNAGADVAKAKSGGTVKEHGQAKSKLPKQAVVGGVAAAALLAIAVWALSGPEPGTADPVNSAPESVAIAGAAMIDAATAAKLADEARSAGIPDKVVALLQPAPARPGSRAGSGGKAISLGIVTSFASAAVKDARSLAALVQAGSARRTQSLKDGLSALEKSAAAVAASRLPDESIAATRELIGSYRTLSGDIASARLAAKAAQNDPLAEGPAALAPTGVAAAGTAVAQPQAAATTASSSAGLSSARRREFANAVSSARSIARKVIRLGPRDRPGSDASDQEKQDFRSRQGAADAARNYEKYLSELESSMRGVSTEADAVKLIANANQTRAYLQDLLKRSEATLQ